MLGYFIEVPAAHGKTLTQEPHVQTFIHRQTMANAMRFTTAELAELEGRIARAHGAALDRRSGRSSPVCVDAVLAAAPMSCTTAPMRWPNST